jgi:hypothetical protein
MVARIRNGWISTIRKRATAVAVALVVACALAAPAQASVLVAVPTPAGARVDVSCEPGLETTARELAASADATLVRIAGDLADLPLPRVVHIQVVRDAGSLASVAPAGRGAPPYAIGVAYPDLGVVSIALARNGQPVDANGTLRHELAHVALGAALGERVPRWLHEGFANQHGGEWSWDRVETLAGMAWFGGIVPIDDLDRRFPAEELPADRAYAESYDFVGYLARRGRYEDGSDEGDRWPFRRFLGALGHGADLDAAAVTGFGKPLHALFDEWRDSLAKRYLFAPIGLFGVALWIGCAGLLALAWWRRRRINRARLAQWEREEIYEPAVVSDDRLAGPGSMPDSR